MAISNQLTELFIQLAEFMPIFIQLAELFFQLAEFMPNFIRLDELFIPLVEFLLIFMLLAESTRRTRRVYSVLNPCSDFSSQTGLPTHRSILPKLNPHVKLQTLRITKEI